MDLAELGLKVDSKPVVQGTDALNKFSKSAHGAEDAVDDFNKGAKSADATTGRFTSSLGKMGGSLTLLKNLFVGLAAGFSINAIGGAASAYTDFTNRLHVAGAQGEDFITVQDRLFAAANKAGAPIGALGQLYSRASLSTQALGVSQEKLLDFVDGVTASLKVQGGSAESASGALLQLSQALGSGVVHAEEFNSILEGAPTIAQAAANGWNDTGTSVANLRTMVINGQVSSKQFFDAFLKGSEAMKAQADGLGVTLGQAFTTLGNGFIRLVGSLDQTLGVTSLIARGVQALGQGMDWLSGHLDVVAAVLKPIAPLMIAAFGPMILGYAAELAAMIGGPLLKSVTSLFLLLVNNPITAVGAAIVVLMGYLVDWQSGIAGLIKIWGAFTYAWYSFWGDEAGQQRSIQIVLNADEAAAKLLGTAKQMSQQVTAGLNLGANQAAPTLTNAVAIGGQKAAASIASAQDVALSRYQDMNGRLIKEIGDTVIAGGQYVFNQATGEIRKAGETAGEAMGSSIATSSDTGAKSFSSAIEKAGSNITYNLSSAMSDVLVGFNAFGGDLLATVNDMRSIVRAQIQQMQAQARLTSGQAALVHQQAMTERTNRNRNGDTGRSYSSSSADVSSTSSGNVAMPGAGFASGGTFTVPGHGSGDTKNVSFRAEPGEQVTIQPNSQNKNSGEGKDKLQINNYFSPEELLKAMQTQAGKNIVQNIISSDPQAFRAALGV